MSKVIDANLYWFPEELFTNEELAERFLAEIPVEYGVKGSLKQNPETGVKQYVIEKPRGSENLNYVQGDYVLEKQLADMDRAGVGRAVLKLSCQQEWMSLDMCRVFNDGMAAHAKASGGRMAALGVVPPKGTPAVFKEIDRSCRRTMAISIWTTRRSRRSSPISMSAGRPATSITRRCRCSTTA